MPSVSRRTFLAAAGLAGAVSRMRAQSAGDDVILKALREELERSRKLKAPGASSDSPGDDAPYFISYTLDDADNFSAAATLGAATQTTHNRFRAPLVEVRVGSYDFDNTGHVYSGYYDGARYDTESLPLDDSYAELRQRLWLATDFAFKAAIESIARKRATLNNAAVSAEKLPDYSKADAFVKLDQTGLAPVDQDLWVKRVEKLSETFRRYPAVLASGVEFNLNQDVTYFVDTEGTALRYQDDTTWYFARAEGQASDGMYVRDALGIPALGVAQLPGDADIEKQIRAMGDNVQALVNAPLGDAFTGPVLFEPLAAAQLFAQLLGDNLHTTRKPVTDPRRPLNLSESEFQSRMGGRVLPEWMDVADDPTADMWHGRPLIGGYPFDMEGVKPRPVSVIEKGVFKAFLATRQPAKNALVSSGHARLMGGFGAHAAAISNLLVQAREAEALSALKARLIQMCKDRDLPYGLLIRKLDFPFAGSNAEIQSLQATSTQSGGSIRPLSPPLLAYRVYPDGREQLVRGLRFKGVRTRSLRDILAASSETAVLDYINNGAPLARAGVGGYIAPTSVVAPGVLFDELEVDRGQEQLEKPPIVSPPSA